MAKLGLNILSGEQKNLVLSRKLGFSAFVDQADRWLMKNTGAADCYIDNQYSFTVFLWSHTMGQLCCADEDEEMYYRDQITKFCDPVASD